MSTVDLERLTAKQTYFIPVKSTELKNKILKELLSSTTTEKEVTSWGIVEDHNLSFIFKYDLMHCEIQSETWGMKRGTHKRKKKVKDLFENIEKMGREGFDYMINKILPNYPREVFVAIKKIEDNGCLCKVECKPSLYDKLLYLQDYKTNDFEIQNAYLSCKRFLEIIFEGGLAGIPLGEEKTKVTTKSCTSLLINDQTSHRILEKIEDMLNQATYEIFFCGWIGTLLLPKINELHQKGVKIRFITHQSTELKGKPGKKDVELAFSEIISIIGKNCISRRPECHCRVLIVDNKALIGSMDMNSISLTGTHREIAVYTEDPDIVRTLRNYFNEIFSPIGTVE